MFGTISSLPSAKLAPVSDSSILMGYIVDFCDIRLLRAVYQPSFKPSSTIALICGIFFS